jgi:excisionase family DNA binding protein
METVTDRLLTVAEFSHAFGVSKWLTRRMIKAGALPSIQVGRRHRISSRAATAWIEAASRARAKRPARNRKTAAA